jgi:predicted Ser/Thr protein kinase
MAEREGALMRTRQAWQEVDPLSLPEGFEVGRWRVTGWGGRGTYGTLYRVERVGREAEGPFALKLAIQAGDERFEREARLLSRLSSPHVPRFVEQGEWVHPSGPFPYVVMEWVSGEPLYEWAARRNPTSRQVLRVLAQVARALEATHAAAGVHRDVKGANVLVRLSDGRALLTDFGAGYYRGAATLTSKLLAPGTPAYRSPEAWAFVEAFERHPTAHYRASACDDLFALGVMGYRLVTDEYPPPTQPGERGSEVWREERGLRAPRELNPRVSAELEAVIMRLLAVAPVERFKGRAREAAEALEYAAQGEGSHGDEPLFGWSEQPGLRERSAREARLAAAQEAAVREHAAAREAKVRRRQRLGAWNAAAVACLLAAGLTLPLRSLHEAGAVTDNKAQGNPVAVGGRAGTSSTGAATGSPGEDTQGISAPMPEQPLPEQGRPPCKRFGEVEIRGGCWHELARAKPPCKEPGKEEAFEWKGACYGPSPPSGRKPTSGPP